MGKRRGQVSHGRKLGPGKARNGAWLGTQSPREACLPRREARMREDPGWAGHHQGVFPGKGTEGSQGHGPWLIHLCDPHDRAWYIGGAW